MRGFICKFYAGLVISNSSCTWKKQASRIAKPREHAVAASSPCTHIYSHTAHNNTTNVTQMERSALTIAKSGASYLPRPIFRRSRHIGIDQHWTEWACCGMSTHSHACLLASFVCSLGTFNIRMSCAHPLLNERWTAFFFFSTVFACATPWECAASLYIWTDNFGISVISKLRLTQKIFFFRDMKT